jgi:hypothetical protein
MMVAKIKAKQTRTRIPCMQEALPAHVNVWAQIS